MYQRTSTVFLSNDDVRVFLRLYVLLYADDTLVMADMKRDCREQLMLLRNAVTFGNSK